MKTITDENMMVQVIYKKKMTFAEYKKTKAQSEKRGFKVQAYEVGFFSDGTKPKI